MVKMNRKSISAMVLSLVMAISSLAAFTPMMEVRAATPDSRKLIVYYSLTGNADFVTNQIQSLTGADVFTITPVEPYSTEFDETSERVNRERDEGILPELVGGVNNLAEYDVIFLGTPNWFGTLSNPMQAFIASHDLAGKTIVPFSTHSSSGF
jgi:flavodoxin